MVRSRSAGPAGKRCPRPWTFPRRKWNPEGTSASPASSYRRGPDTDEPCMTADDLSPLVRRAQRGDTMAMSELLACLTPYAARVCGPIALADGADTAQETPIAVFRPPGEALGA